MRYLYYGLFVIVAYLALAMAPLFVLLVGPDIPGRGFWRELSVGLGFAGLSMMGLQFFLTGRFQGITSPYGIDVVYHFHRAISLVAFIFLLLHPVILFLSAPAAFGLLNPFLAPGWITGGSIALFAFALIVVSSLYRLKLGLSYERWRIIHGYVAVAAVTLSLWHMIGVNYYLQGDVRRGLWIAIAITWSWPCFISAWSSRC
jgi:predicted ferric reductase